MKQFILVTGAGRSGTSLMGKILYNLNYSIGNVNKKKEKISQKVVAGYFEDRNLEISTKLWSLAIKDNANHTNPFFVPIENVYRGLNPIRKILFRLGDYQFKRTLIKNRKKEFFFIKRTKAIWWIWSITKICKSLNLPIPKIIYCDRKDEDRADSIYEAQGANYEKAIEYSKKCRKQITYLLKNKRQIVPEIRIINYEDYYKNPKKIINTLSEFLEKDKKEIEKAIQKSLIQK